MAYLLSRVNALALIDSVRVLKAGLQPDQPGLPDALVRLLEQVKPVAGLAETT
jgi:hypothetical protein